MLNDFFILMKQELILCVIIFILLFVKVLKTDCSSKNVMGLVNVLLIVNIIVGCFGNTTGSLFGNMFQVTKLASLEKNILTFGTLIISLQSFAWLKDHKHVAEFYILLLSTLLGMEFMISSGNFLMFYLGLELSSIPLAALANFDLEKRISSEAAFKFIVSSAFSSGILLLGISFLYGAIGSVSFVDLSARMVLNPFSIFSFILILAGFGFKISMVPFHLWTADVYEGAPVAVSSYLSVISKGAVLFIFVTVLYRVFANLLTIWYPMICLLSVLTMFIGNIFAVRQQNLKRFLGFSSISQVGYVLIGISGDSRVGVATVVYFVIIYLFANLGAFGVVSVVSAQTGKEKITDFQGFYKNNKLLSWVMAISMFSLAGIPPTAGFFAKFFLMISGARMNNYLLLFLAAINMVIALYYYLRVVKAIFMEKSEEPMEKVKIPSMSSAALWICIVGTVLVGIAGCVYTYIYSLC